MVRLAGLTPYDRPRHLHHPMGRRGMEPIAGLALQVETDEPLVLFTEGSIQLNPQALQLRVGVDGSPIVLPSGCRTAACIEEFETLHTAAGFEDFFSRIEERQARLIDGRCYWRSGSGRSMSLIRARWLAALHDVQLKLARFKEIFPRRRQERSDRYPQNPGAVDHLPMA